MVSGALAALGGVHLAAHLVPLPEDFFSEGSQVVSFEDDSFAHVFLSPDDKWRIPVRLSEVDPDYVAALLRLEDKRFYSHSGVDVQAIFRAATKNFRRGRVVSGASTLTMQLVRVREPRPRTLRSKVVEAFRALQVEARYSKQEILAAYLEYVPYGRNLEGVEAAALSYFGHRASDLSLAEIATLLAVPQNPNRRYPKLSHARRLKAARDDIAGRLLQWGVFADSEGQDLAASPVPSALQPFPRLAPHAAYWLRQRHSSQPRIRTTLQRGLQKQAERIMQGAGQSLSHRGIQHGAIVVVDHESGRVRALVGSPGFWQAGAGSQIASFAVPRSPGSALKPFIYGLAIEAGQVLPEHLVLDVPVSFGTYVPKNYDGVFSGLVKAEDALSKSLNVPFVNMLQDIGVDRLIGHLETWGVTTLNDQPGYYGLSAAIGGLEISPLELAGLYAMLARGGSYRPVHVLACNGAPPEQVPGVSAGTAFLVQRALRLKDRPDFPARRRFTGAPPNISWKTGTSYGHRDAWAAGSNMQHTAVVWLGNLDQTPSANLVGAAAAGPLLFDVLEGAAARREALAPGPPKDLTQVQVCAYSGHRVGPGCQHEQTVWARTSAVPTEPCPYHVAMDVDVHTGLALAPRCRSQHSYRTQKFLVWPASLRRWLKAASRHAPEPPAYLEGCEGTPTRGGPRILSPSPGQHTLLIPGVAASKQEIPLAAESGSHHLSWFMDGKFLGTVPSAQRLWWVPSAGDHTVVVSDEAGRTAQQTVRVRRAFGDTEASGG